MKTSCDHARYDHFQDEKNFEILMSLSVGAKISVKTITLKWSSFHAIF